MKFTKQPPTIKELREILNAVDEIGPKDILEERRDNTFGFVYFITDGQYVKIGVSTNPKRRLNELQTANPRKLSILHLIPSSDPYWLEASLHEYYSDKHIAQEWYNILHDIKWHSDDYLTLKDIEKMLKISHATAYNLVRDPEFPAIRVGKSIRIQASEFDKYICMKIAENK